MSEMSVIWLRVAALLYSLGLLHAILTLVRRREQLFRVALGAFGLGAVFHFVSIIEEGLTRQRAPIGNFYETLSMCAFLVAAVYLFVHWRYKLESLSVFLFPLVFMMSLVATFANPVSAFSSPIVRDAWLIVHIVFILFGFVALLLTAAGSLLYLFQERELKAKKPRRFYYRLPPLGTLDDLISKSMGIGFVLITLGAAAILLPPASPRHPRRPDFEVHGDRIRPHYPGRCSGEHVGLHRARHPLDQQARGRHFLLHLGRVSRTGISADHGGLART
jgi:ABC-type uncharacterized transport system permease subunit